MGNVYLTEDITDKFGNVHVPRGWYWFVRFFDSNRIVVQGDNFKTVIPTKKVDCQKWV